MSLNKVTLSLEEGANETLTATVDPSNTSDKAVIYSSSDDTVATVTPKQGKVNGVKAGSAKITAMTSNGLSAECDVTITEKSGGA